MVEQPGDSAGEEFMTWGPDHDRPPLVALNVQWRDGPGGLRAVFTLLVPHWHVWLASCRLMQWGRGERVLLPDASWINRAGRRTYKELIVFATNEEQRLFEEAARDPRRPPQEHHSRRAPDDDGDRARRNHRRRAVLT